MLNQRNCAECNAELFEDTTLALLPCPNCGSLTRSLFATITETIRIADGYRTKQKRPGMKRPVVEQRNEPSFFVKDNEWHRRHMVIDRENDLYVEHITRMSTGEVILDKQEKLSEHLGHGDDKSRKKNCPNHTNGEDQGDVK